SATTASTATVKGSAGSVSSSPSGDGSVAPASSLDSAVVAVPSLGWPVTGAVVPGTAGGAMVPGDTTAVVPGVDGGGGGAVDGAPVGIAGPAPAADRPSTARARLIRPDPKELSRPGVPRSSAVASRRSTASWGP